MIFEYLKPRGLAHEKKTETIGVIMLTNESVPTIECVTNPLHVISCGPGCCNPQDWCNPDD